MQIIKLEFRYEVEVIEVKANEKMNISSPIITKGKASIFKFSSAPLNGLLIDAKNGTIYGIPTVTAVNYPLVVSAEYKDKVTSTFTIHITSTAEIFCQATADYMETAAGDVAYSMKCPLNEVGMKSKRCLISGEFEAGESDILCSGVAPKYLFIKYTYTYTDFSCSPKYFQYKIFLEALKIYLNSISITNQAYLEFDTSTESTRYIRILLLEIVSIDPELLNDLIGNDDFYIILKSKGWICEFNVKKPTVVFDFKGEPTTIPPPQNSKSLSTAVTAVISVLAVIIVIFAIVMMVSCYCKKTNGDHKRRKPVRRGGNNKQSLRILGSKTRIADE